jgi:hypothetical protein
LVFCLSCLSLPFCLFPAVSSPLFFSSVSFPPSLLLYLPLSLLSVSISLLYLFSLSLLSVSSPVSLPLCLYPYASPCCLFPFFLPFFSPFSLFSISPLYAFLQSFSPALFPLFLSPSLLLSLPFFSPLGFSICFYVCPLSLLSNYALFLSFFVSPPVSPLYLSSILHLYSSPLSILLSLHPLSLTLVSLPLSNS